MSNVEKWSVVAGENVDAAPDGALEGHNRTDVSNISREQFRSIRQRWEDMAWFDKTKGPTGKGFAIVKGSGTDKVKLTHEDTPTDASGKFKVGARIRIGDGSTYVYGFVSATAYANPDTTITIDLDGASVIQATPTICELHVTDGFVGNAAFSTRGTTLVQDPPQIPSIDDLGDVAVKNMGPGNGIDADLLDGQHASEIIAASAAASGIGLINGNFEIGQRGHALTRTTEYPTDNAAYVADGWMLLMGEDATHPAPGSGVVDIDLVDSGAISGKADPKAIRVTANSSIDAAPNEKFGLLQWLPADACQNLDGAVVSLSVWCKRGVTDMDNSRIGILAWTGTADAMPADPIVDWKGATVTPTVVANITLFESASFSGAADWSEHTLENVTLPAETKNIGIMIWLDDTAWSDANSIEYTGVSLVEGIASRPYAHEDYSANLQRCQRFFNSTFEEGDLVQEKGGDENSALRTLTNTNASGSVLWEFGTSMFKTPTVVVLQPASDGGATNAVPWNVTTSADASVVTTSTSKRRVHWDVAGGNDDVVILHATADASLP